MIGLKERLPFIKSVDDVIQAGLLDERRVNAYYMAITYVSTKYAANFDKSTFRMSELISKLADILCLTETTANYLFYKLTPPIFIPKILNIELGYDSKGFFGVFHYSDRRQSSRIYCSFDTGRMLVNESTSVVKSIEIVTICGRGGSEERIMINDIIISKELTLQFLSEIAE